MSPPGESSTPESGALPPAAGSGSSASSGSPGQSTGSPAATGSGTPPSSGEGTGSPDASVGPPPDDAGADTATSPVDGSASGEGGTSSNPQILALESKVAQAAIAQYGGGDCGWVEGAFFAGVMAAYDSTHDATLLAAARSWGQKAGFGACNVNGKGVTNADNQCCQQTYIELYLQDKTPANAMLIKSGQGVFDSMIATPIPGASMAGWWWADALFMSPPSMARMGAATGDPKYFQLLDTMYWAAEKPLFDPAHGLFWRDGSFVNKPIYWSRGNGWVVAGLARILDYLPMSDAHYNDFVALFKTMAAALVPLQNQTDGMWRSDLLMTTGPNKEASGSGFFTFALAWGVDHGVLDRAMYLPVVKKGWDGLASVVDAQGHVGWVQGVGSAPGPTTATGNAAYGAGAFLLAGSEVAKVY
jgi:rhamnogalacturonyl hydrolase YesR